MKAVQITEPFDINVVEKEAPKAKEGEALLKVLYSGICGADVASYTGNQPFTTYPRIPGHEFSAMICLCWPKANGVSSKRKSSMPWWLQSLDTFVILLDFKILRHEYKNHTIHLIHPAHSQ